MGADFFEFEIRMFLKVIRDFCILLGFVCACLDVFFCLVLDALAADDVGFLICFFI